MQMSIKDYDKHNDKIKLNCLKLYEWGLNHNLRSIRIVIADQYYYDKTLEQRRDILSAPSIQFLCKTIIFENTAYNDKYQDDEYYPKYVAVMVQYVAKIHTQKLGKLLRQSQKQHSSHKIAKQHFHFRLADENVSNKLSGYEHNGVVPVLMRQKMPIIFSDRIEKLKPQFFWMGAGHPWVKMRISFQEFKITYEHQFILGDITY